MENENRAFFNSPVIHKNTPIKRLGLSRKRKSCGSVCNVNAKIQACGEKSSDSPVHLEVCKLIFQICNRTLDHIKFPLETLEQNVCTTNIEVGGKLAVNYEKQIEFLKRRITEDEEKLKALKCNKSNINQLEDLIELWKNGCKNAFLHFSQLLKDRQTENIDFKAVLTKLGVWETMVEYFDSDSELSISEFDQ